MRSAASRCRSVWFSFHSSSVCRPFRVWPNGSRAPLDQGTDGAEFVEHVARICTNKQHRSNDKDCRRTAKSTMDSRKRQRTCPGTNHVDDAEDQGTNLTIDPSFAPCIRPNNVEPPLMAITTNQASHSVCQDRREEQQQPQEQSGKIESDTNSKNIGRTIVERPVQGQCNEGSILENPVRSALNFIVDRCDSRQTTELSGAQQTSVVQAFLVGVQDEHNPAFNSIHLPTFVQEHQATLSFPEKVCCVSNCCFLLWCTSVVFLVSCRGGGGRLLAPLFAQWRSRLLRCIVMLLHLFRPFLCSPNACCMRP